MPHPIPLQKFIADALCQVVDAVHDAQTRTAASESGQALALIAPAGELSKSGPLTIDLGSIAFRQLSMLAFDLAVTAGEQSQDQAQIGVLATFIGIGAGAKTSSEGRSESIHRLRFSVPVVFSASKTS